jgi:hypothetical protein
LRVILKVPTSATEDVERLIVVPEIVKKLFVGESE